MNSTTTDLHIIVEGWRQLPHSYALVNHFQLRELLRRPQVRLYHRDHPFVKPTWVPAPGLVAPADEAAVCAIPAPPPSFCADVTYRIACPLDPKPGTSRRTVIFAATEFGRILPNSLAGGNVADFVARLADSDTLLITPSVWSRAGLLASGVDPDRVIVVPHGIDPHIFHPLDHEPRNALRETLGWNQNDAFVFFTNGLMWRQRHGIAQLLQAFGRVADRHPQARLVIKGREQLFGAQAEIVAVAKEVLDARAQDRVWSRLAYIGGNLAAAQLAALYQCADTYVTTSQAEGFNLPALEAAACGLPVICPALGPTSEFLDPAYTLAIDSRLDTAVIEGEAARIVAPDVDHLTTLMLAIIERSSFRALARAEAWQRPHAEFNWCRVIDDLLPTLGQG